LRPKELRLLRHAQTPKQAEEIDGSCGRRGEIAALPDFLKRFAARAASLANADWGGVVVFEENAAEFYSGNRVSRRAQLSDARLACVQGARNHGDAQVCILPQEKSSTGVLFHPIEFERANGCGMPAAAPARAART